MITLIFILIGLSALMFVAATAIITVMYLDNRKQVKLIKSSADLQIQYAQAQLNERDRRILSLMNASMDEQRLKWINSLTSVNYRNEVEVEIKFVHSLLQFLGYSDIDTQIRVPITVQVGRQPVTGQADWVALRGNGDRCVIEAKGPNQQLDKQVQEQARSYAFALRASTYVVTNGLTIQIFQRGVTDDECVLHCSVKNLAAYWAIVNARIGKVVQN